MGGFEAHLFGRLSLRAEGQDIQGLDGAKVQELLCYLLLHRGRRHPREMLAGLLWGERPTEMARKYLRQAVWQLQSALQASGGAIGHLLHVDSDSICLVPQVGFWLDVETFECAFVRVRGIPGKDLDPEAVEVLRAAIQLYDGDLLEGWYQDWCLLARERLQVIYLSLLDKLMGACEASNDIESGLDYGGRILMIDRAREQTHRRLMVLYAISGDRTGALRQYARCVAALRDDLAVEPSRATIALHEAIRHDRLDSLTAASSRPAWREPATSPLAETIGQLRHLRGLLDDIHQRVQQDIQSVDLALAQRQGPR